MIYEEMCLALFMCQLTKPPLTMFCCRCLLNEEESAKDKMKKVLDLNEFHISSGISRDANKIWKGVVHGQRTC